MSRLLASLCIVLAAQLTALTILRGAESDIQFLESQHGAGTQIECKRNGVVIYKHVEMPVSQSHVSTWIFYWDGKDAVRILTIGGETSIQQYSGLPVSFTVHVTTAGQPNFVSIQKADGTVIDGLLLKSNGRLTPVPTAELPTPTPSVVK